jgi:hypothetical protein
VLTKNKNSPNRLAGAISNLELFTYANCPANPNALAVAICPSE